MASFPAVRFGPLYYRQLENEKIIALKAAFGNFDSRMVLSDTARSDLAWWIENLPYTKKPIIEEKIDATIHTDASDKGYGYANIESGTSGGGEWLPEERCWHINVKELKAVELGLKAICRDMTNMHIRVRSDSQTTVAYIREMGGSKSLQCNQVARAIWLWASARKNWISACHIPGVSNVQADQLSRKFSHETEWMLDPHVFHRVTTCFSQFPVHVDLFATRTNRQLEKYVAWRPDPDAWEIDAFSVNWSELRAYVFPPFSLIPTVLHKINVDQATVIAVVPHWPTQSWFPALLKLLADHPRVLPQSTSLLRLPGLPEKIHPLHRKLKLLACLLSGKDTIRKDYQDELVTSSCSLGAKEHEYNINRSFRNGNNIVTRMDRIHFIPL